MNLSVIPAHTLPRALLLPEAFIARFGVRQLKNARLHPRGFAPVAEVARISTDYLHRQVLAPPGRNAFGRFSSASDLLLLGYPQAEVNAMVKHWAGRITRYKVSGHRALAANHPAVVQGISLHHHSVKPVTAETDILSSAVSNTKIGRYMIDPQGNLWGEIFTVTWEERKTCPRTCGHWQDCYTNNTPLMRRKHYNLAREEEILALMEAQLVKHLNRIRTPYLYVRLHQAGDFPTARYVEWWGHMLARYPRLHAFGYTHWPADTPIGQAVDALNEEHWHHRWRIYRSGNGQVSHGANTFADASQARKAGNMPCPEQVGRVPTCGECQMCFPGAHSRGRNGTKSIGFIQHAKPTDQLDLGLATTKQVRPYRAKPGKHVASLPEHPSFWPNTP